MKKFLMLTICAFSLAACQTTEPAPVPECPSCNPPTRHYEVVTECSDFSEKDFGDGSYTQCRYCVNKIYSNGVDVTAQFKKPTATTQQPRNYQKTQGNVKQKGHPCAQ